MFFSTYSNAYILNFQHLNVHLPWGRKDLLRLVLVLYLLLPYALASSNHRILLNTTLQFRGSISKFNIFPGLRLFMQVLPDETPVLFKVFYETCHRLETQYVRKITRVLFPNYELPDVKPTSISIEAMDAHCSQQGIISLGALLKGASGEKRHFLKMVLFEWNYLLQAISSASPLLMKKMKAINRFAKIDSFTFRERIDAAMLMQSSLESHYNIKDAWLLFHLLEYFRHLMVLKPSLFTENGFSNEQLEQLWMAFTLNSLKHQ